MAKAGSGKIINVKAGDAYIFEGHESHYLKGGPDGAHIVCIFTPACTGLEVSSKKSQQKSVFDGFNLYYRKPRKMVHFHCWIDGENPRKIIHN